MSGSSNSSRSSRPQTPHSLTLVRTRCPSRGPTPLPEQAAAAAAKAVSAAVAIAPADVAQAAKSSSVESSEHLSFQVSADTIVTLLSPQTLLFTFMSEPCSEKYQLDDEYVNLRLMIDNQEIGCHQQVLAAHPNLLATVCSGAPIPFAASDEKGEAKRPEEESKKDEAAATNSNGPKHSTDPADPKEAKRSAKAARKAAKEAKKKAEKEAKKNKKSGELPATNTSSQLTRFKKYSLDSAKLQLCMESLRACLSFAYSACVIINNKRSALKLMAAGKSLQLPQICEASRIFLFHQRLFHSSTHDEQDDDNEHDFKPMQDEMMQYLADNVGLFLENMQQVQPNMQLFLSHLQQLLDLDLPLDTNEETLCRLVLPLQQSSLNSRIRRSLIRDTDLLRELDSKVEPQQQTQQRQQERGAKPSVLVLCCDLSVAMSVVTVPLKSNSEPEDTVYLAEMLRPSQWRLDTATALQTQESLLLFGGLSDSLDSVSFAAEFTAYEFRPLPEPSLARVSCAAASCGQPLAALVCGGVQHEFASSTDGERVLDSVEMLQEDEWCELCNLPRPMHSHAAVGNAEHLYICGGVSALSLDPLPLSQLWRLELEQPDGRRHWHELGQLQQPRWKHQLALDSDCLWALGGNALGDDGLNPVPCQTVESFQLNKPGSCWTVRANRLPFDCHRLLSIAHKGHSVYCIGEDSEGRVLVRFCLSSGKWDSELCIPLPDTACHLICLHAANRRF